MKRGLPTPESTPCCSETGVPWARKPAKCLATGCSQLPLEPGGEAGVWWCCTQGWRPKGTRCAAIVGIQVSKPTRAFDSPLWHQHSRPLPGKPGFSTGRKAPGQRTCWQLEGEPSPTDVVLLMMPLSRGTPNHVAHTAHQRYWRWALGSSLVVQWLGPRYSTAGARAPPLVRELRPHMRGTAV